MPPQKKGKFTDKKKEKEKEKAREVPQASGRFKCLANRWSYCSSLWDFRNPSQKKKKEKKRKTKWCRSWYIDDVMLESSLESDIWRSFNFKWGREACPELPCHCWGRRDSISVRLDTCEHNDVLPGDAWYWIRSVMQIISVDTNICTYFLHPTGEDIRPQSYFKFLSLPLLFKSALAPRNRVTRVSGWYLLLWNGTTLQDPHRLSVVNGVYVNRHEHMTLPQCCRQLGWFLLCYHDAVCRLSDGLIQKHRCSPFVCSFAQSVNQSSHQTEKVPNLITLQAD